MHMHPDSNEFDGANQPPRCKWILPMDAGTFNPSPRNPGCAPDVRLDGNSFCEMIPDELVGHYVQCAAASQNNA